MIYLNQLYYKMAIVLSFINNLNISLFELILLLLYLSHSNSIIYNN